MNSSDTRRDDAQHMQRVEAIFRACLELHSGPGADSAQTAAAISDKLNSMCGDDFALRAEVESLLRLHREMDVAPETSRAAEPAAFLDPDKLRGQLEGELGLGVHGILQVGMGARGAAAAGAGTRIGGYTIMGLLGSGGMGVVYVAEQDRPRREVALKLIRHGLATPSMVSRFEREAEVLGRLSHVGIAQIFEAGVETIEPIGNSGAASIRTPYIAMELVRGPTILEHVRETNASPRAILAIVADVCDAVQHAHLRGVIHRDLKPQNVLIDRTHGSPQPKVLDFGVARAIAADDAIDGAIDGAVASADSVTVEGQLLGTLAYMSVEQVSGNARDLDTRTDVYALGAILYHLLSNVSPFDASQRSIPEMIRAICDEEPIPLGSIAASLRGEIETIVGKAMSKDRARRYQSAAELADDVRRFLRGEPIAARQDSLLYVLRKQVKRHRAWVAMALLVVIGVIGFAVFAGIKERQQSRVAREAVIARHEAELQRGRADLNAARISDELSASRIEQGRLFGESGAFRTAEEFIWREHLLHPTSLRSRWALWELYSHYLCRLTIPAHDGMARCISWRPDGAVIASAGTDHLIKFWNASNGALVSSIQTDFERFDNVLFTNDGNTIVSAADGRVVLWDVKRGIATHELDLKDNLSECVDVSADNALLVTGGRGGRVCVWNVQTREIIWSNVQRDARDAPLAITSVRFDRAAQRVAAGYMDGTVRVWSVSHGRVSSAPNVFTGHHDQVLSISFNADSHTMATASRDRVAKIWDLESGACTKTIEPRNGTLRDVTFSPDGSLLAVVGWWRVDVYETATWNRYGPNNVDRNSGYEALQARFNPSGKELATCGAPGAIRITAMDTNAGVQTLEAHGQPVLSVASARDGDSVVLASTSTDGRIDVWSRSIVAQSNSTEDGWTLRRRTRTGRSLRALALTDDGRQIAVSGTDGLVEIYDARTGARVAQLKGHQGLVSALAFSHDGTRLISGGVDVVLRIWKRGDGTWSLQREQPAAPGEILSVSVSADDRTIMSSHRAQTVRFWSLADGAPLARRECAATIWTAVFAHRGARMAMGTWDRVGEIWDGTAFLAAPNAVHPPTPDITSLLGHTQLVCGVAFSADDQILATASQDGTVKLWDARTSNGGPHTTQSALATLDAHANEAFQVTFLPAPFEHQVAAGYQDGNVRIWDLSRFDGFIAGQLEFQIARHRDELGKAFDERAVRQATSLLTTPPK